MNQPQESPEFDRIFDQTLPSYAPPEPRPGLEQRILAHMKANAASHPDFPPRRTFRLLPRLLWMVGGLAVATVLVLLMIPCNCVSRSDADRLARRQPALSPSQPALLQARAEPPVRHPHRPALPSVAVASELTPQELLLTHFAVQHPGAALDLARSTPSLSKPIAFKPLDPEPIRLQALSVQPIHIEPIDLAVQLPPSY